MYNFSEKEMVKINQAKELEKISTRYGISYCLAGDDLYPKEMSQLKNMPPLLYYKGNIEVINKCKNVAVIGSRKLSEAGKQLSYYTGEAVAKEGLNLVNGLALGCDTEAIKGALAAGGRCIAVMPCGLQEVQPKSNQKLAEEILEKGGCLLSEYPVGTGVQKYQYVERDRLQSGISQGVLVIEAEKTSGTMHTADFAARQFKRLACYHYKLLESSSGNRYLEETSKAQVLKTKADLLKFIENIKKEEVYEQIKFDFSC